MSERRIDRRTFLGGALLAASQVSGLPGWARGQGPMPDGLIVRQRNPDNLEMPFGSLGDFVTPTDRFFIRSHFAVPRIDPRTWRLRVEGAVTRRLEMGLAD